MKTIKISIPQLGVTYSEEEAMGLWLGVKDMLFFYDLCFAMAKSREEATELFHRLDGNLLVVMPMRQFIGNLREKFQEEE